LRQNLIMKDKELIIRLLEETDIEKVNDFHNRFYLDDRDRDKFKWEFIDAPAGKAIYVVALDANRDRIVGTQCSIPIHLRLFNGEVILSAKSEDTLVDPEYRGMQIFEKMYDLLFKECNDHKIKYIWGFTSALKPFQKIGFQTPYTHSQSLLVLDVFPAYRYLASLNKKNSIIDKLKILMLASLSRLKWCFSFASKLRDIQVKIHNDNVISENLNDLAEYKDVKHSKCFIINQDQDYIKWRINTNPYHKKIFALDFLQGNKRIANIIFNYHKDGTWYLIQALFDETISKDLKKNIFHKSIKTLIKNESPSLIRAWNFNQNEINLEEIEAFRRAGLIYLSRGIYFVWKDLEGNGKLNPSDFVLSRMASQGVI
jgi:hypothetical protein